jgi:hypothetical protein
MVVNMLTGLIYLSSELIGGVFDEANRSLNEVQVQIFDPLLSFCRWSVRGIKIRFASYYAERGASRHDNQLRRVESGPDGRVFLHHGQ